MKYKNLSQAENFQETLLISSRFPGVLDTLNFFANSTVHNVLIFKNTVQFSLHYWD